MHAFEKGITILSLVCSALTATISLYMGDKQLALAWGCCAIWAANSLINLILFKLNEK